MKSKMRFAFMISGLFIATGVLADNCPPLNSVSDNGKWVVPSGWLATKNGTPGTGTAGKNPIFGWAFIHPDVSTVSCTYVGSNHQSDKLIIRKLTSTKPKPIGANWITKDGTVGCGQYNLYPSNPEKCQWKE